MDEKLELLKRRLMACFIDCVLIGTLSILAHIPLRIIGLPQLIEILMSGMIFLFFGFLVLAKDGPTWFIDFLRGQSPGKKAFGIIVVKPDGKTNITFKESIIRNIPLGIPYFIAVFCQAVRIIPFISGFLLFFAFLGFLVSLVIILVETLLIYKDPEGRRWGDKQAETKVVAYD